MPQGSSYCCCRVCIRSMLKQAQLRKEPIPAWQSSIQQSADQTGYKCHQYTSSRGTRSAKLVRQTYCVIWWGKLLRRMAKFYFDEQLRRTPSFVVGLWPSRQESMVNLCRNCNRIACPRYLGVEDPGTFKFWKWWRFLTGYQKLSRKELGCPGEHRIE